MDYALKTGAAGDNRETLASGWRILKPLLAEEQTSLVIAIACVVVTTASNLLAPVLIAHAIDAGIAQANYGTLQRYAVLLSFIYLAALGTAYFQTLAMGAVARSVLFQLRDRLFRQLSDLPIAFFAQNRAGDIISRINGDTQRINQFFAQLVQMFGQLFQILGAGILLLSLNWRLGLVSLMPALGILLITRGISRWIRRTSRDGLDSLGALSGDVSESLANFRPLVAFNRMDYFREKLRAANDRNYLAAVRAAISSGLPMPLYTLAGSAASALVLATGLWLIGRSDLTIGLLIAYLLYVTAFYNPLRQLAAVWSNLQMAMAALDRVSGLLALKNELVTIADAPAGAPGVRLAFENVSFSYPNGKRVLSNVSFRLEPGHTYALVGPTGGGKTTTAMLMARLYDPGQGLILLDGRDIRAFTAAARANKIGFILQEPLLFSGTIRDNIVFGSDMLRRMSDAALAERIASSGLAPFVNRFEEGLATSVKDGGYSLSLGQKQLIAFLRAVLRQPDILILDEATANIDTVTEQLLEEVLSKLPEPTTKVIIAHRLNTIRNADGIFFVDGGGLTAAGSMQHAIAMLLSNQRMT